MMNKTIKEFKPTGQKMKPAGSMLLTSFTAVMFSILFVACASTPVPNQQITAAEVAIDHAEKAQIADYSSSELVEARANLTAARAAIEEKEMERARHLAQRAQLNADLAEAKANLAKAKSVNEEMQKSTSVIKEEMQRNPGVK